MELLYFILGVLFIQVAIPLIDGISSWFLTWVEVKKAKLTEAINQVNINIQKSADSGTVKILGFSAEEDPSEEDYEEKEDDNDI